jgi:hypothetical protein
VKAILTTERVIIKEVEAIDENEATVWVLSHANKNEWTLSRELKVTTN